MGNRKTWPNHISINMLSQLTGKDRRTVTDRLERVEPVLDEPKKKLFEIKKALPVIFGPQLRDVDGDEEPDFFDPQLERAKLDRTRRRRLELEIDIQKRNLIPKEELEQALADVFGSVRAKLLNIPSKIAQRHHAKLTKKQLQALSKELINETLQELSSQVINDRVSKGN